MSRSKEREQYFSVTGAQYMMQARAAEAEAQRHHRSLLDAGWVYDEKIGQYTHPGVPDTVIMNG